MTTVTKELVLLDVDDIEEAVSAYFGEKVSISEMECILTYFVPMDEGIPKGMVLDILVNKKSGDAFDLFTDNDDSCVYIYKDKEISLNEAFLEPKDIFNFDTKLFKSFKIDTDSSD